MNYWQQRPVTRLRPARFLVSSFILQQQLPAARLMLFSDCGRSAHFQFAEEFAEAAARFLAAD
jgi:hypothetical protein